MGGGENGGKSFFYSPVLWVGTGFMRTKGGGLWTPSNSREVGRWLRDPLFPPYHGRKSEWREASEGLFPVQDFDKDGSEWNDKDDSDKV